MTISGIYKIQSIAKPERCYIGSSIDVHHRWWDHSSRLKKGVHDNSKLQRHFNKYGVADLQFSILLGCDKEYLIANEQFFLDSYKPYFNLRPIANSQLGFKHTEEFKEARRLQMIGNPWRFKKGHHLNDGKPKSKEAIHNMSLALKGRNAWNKGKKGPIQSQETIDKRVAKLRGQKRSEEIKLKFKKPKSEQAKQNMKAAWVVRKMNKSA